MLTPLASGTGVKLLTCPYFSGSVMPSGMRLLPTNLPVPKATNPNPPAPALVHLTESSKTGVNSQNSCCASAVRAPFVWSVFNLTQVAAGFHCT